MGLDMYAWAVPDQPGLKDADQVFHDPDPQDELFYWRKHPNLHGWMEQLYREKGGSSETFNCNTVRVTLEDLDRLERELDKLPETQGFFFGASTPEDKVRDLQFIAAARAAIQAGKAVYYDSWW